MMAVSDTGCGMSAEVQAQIFEPFFTTKEMGKGTGLGLSTVYGIVAQSGGFVAVHSELGQGTRFEIYLPQAGKGEEAKRTRRSRNGEIAGGTETILLVEDEPMIREMLGESLRSLGYRVLEAGEVDQATLVSQRHVGPIHLLMTDVVLPGVGGREIALKLGALRPEMKTIFMSGYTDDAVVRTGILTASVTFLQKPFTLPDMARKVRELLDAAAA
jgi:CheY-like chemotaxis protein